MKDSGILFRMFDEVIAEDKNQVAKWGLQDHTPFEWLTITAEEFGELSKAILERHYGSNADVVKEAIQVATLCLKIATMYYEEKKP